MKKEKGLLGFRLVVAALIPLAASEVLAAPQFPNPVYPVGPVAALVPADLDRDGIQDLLALGSGSFGLSDVLWLRGLGDGTFASAVHIPLTLQAIDMVTADFNGDGNTDLALTSYPEYAGYVLLGAGDGTFGPARQVAPNPVSRLRVADIDHDGNPDLVVEGARFFQALLGRGDGTFAAAPAVPAGDCFDVMPMDVNSDGRDDVITILNGPQDQPNPILIFLGAGDGTFVPGGSLSTGQWAWRLMPADIDGDGRMDFGVDSYPIDPNAPPDTETFLVYFGHGDGTFDRGPSANSYNVNVLLAADFDEDGARDYLTVNNGDQVRVYLRTGARAWTEKPWFYTGIDVWGIVSGDFERDGHADLAMMATTSDAIFVHKGNGDGTFGPALNTAIRDSFLGGLVSDDFNGDGRLDLAAALLEDGQVAFLPGLGDGSFGPEVRFPAGSGPLYGESADLNHDGRKDLVVADRNWGSLAPDPLPNGSVAVLLGNGDGTFQAPVLYEAGLGPVALHLTDLDGDGNTDVIFANGTDGIAEPDLSLFFGTGDGGLVSGGRLRVGAVDVPGYGWTYVMDVASGNFDRDNRRDIVVVTSGMIEPGIPGTVRILRGLGGGAFAAPSTIAETLSSSAVTVSDVEGDGDEDIVVADAGSYTREQPGGLYVLKNDGSGVFDASPLQAAGIGPLDVQVSDLTLDGRSDLVASNNAGYMAILPGQADGSYGPAIDVGLFGFPLAIVQGDFNGDGDPDLMIGSPSGFFLVKNQAPPLAVDVRLLTGGAGSKGSGTVMWTTDAERDLRGFNIVEETPRGTIQLNTAIIRCEQCVTGAGATYSFLVPKHKSGKNIFIQAVHTDGRMELYGPARR